MQKIVFNAHYLMYVDTAMMDYWRALALPYEDSMVALGGDMYVKKPRSNTTPRRTLTTGWTWACAASAWAISVLFQAGLFRGEKLLVSAELVYVFADPATQTSKPVPSTLRALLTGFEAGEAMAAVHVGSWDALGPDAARASPGGVRGGIGHTGPRWRPTHTTRGRPMPCCATIWACLSPRDACCRKRRAWADRPPGPWTASCAARAGADRCSMRCWSGPRAWGPAGGAGCRGQRPGLLPEAGFVVCGEPFVEAGIHHVSMECVL